MTRGVTGLLHLLMEIDLYADYIPRVGDENRWASGARCKFCHVCLVKVNSFNKNAFQ